MQAYDVIVVGAGSAGCVVARRWADTSASVLLLEAGPRNHVLDYRLHMPAALSHVLANDTYNWYYHSEPEVGLNNRRLYCPRGRVLGGSSSINGMIYARGNPADFDQWADVTGYDGWRYEHCLPYFKKVECFAAGEAAYHGSAGAMQLSRGELDNVLTQAYLEAGVQAGFPLNEYMNGRVQEGVGPFDRTISNGKRFSAADGYLKPIRGTPNLHIETRLRVLQVSLKGSGDGCRADGVLCQRANGTVETIAAGKVVMCAGAINSPQLLMLSGVGDAEALQAVGITPRVHLPGVGANLQDHLEVYVQQACTQPVSLAPALRWYRQIPIGIEWYLKQTGAGASNHFEAGGFVRSGADAGWPDVQFHFLPIAMSYDGTMAHRGHGYQLHAGPMKPTSRGAVTLASVDPLVAPRIRFNYATTEEDRDVMRRAIRHARDILAQPAFDPFRGDELQPGPTAVSDVDLDRFVSRHGESAYHPSCTCAMGSVVDESGRVFGVENLNVVDASIMPVITNGNLNAPVLMLAEKIVAEMTGIDVSRAT